MMIYASNAGKFGGEFFTLADLSELFIKQKSIKVMKAKCGLCYNSAIALLLEI